jgi:hypothetical protein
MREQTVILEQNAWVGWLVLALACGAFIEVLDTHSTASLSSISEAYALPLPHRVQMEGEIRSPHFSGQSLVFELSNRGTISCYFRHPPSSLFVFSKEWFVVHATLVSTSRGRLCVVEKMGESHAP